MMDDSGLLDYYREDRDYWRSEAMRLRGACSDLQDVVFRISVPPEPPVGSRYVEGDTVWWRHDVSGWICSKEECRNCPCDWEDVYDYLHPGVVLEFQ